ncbi:hypothetical protein [Pseudomonas sp. SCB32]|nr:hypothetical protein [Pseudomonas sp. SCB32]
MQDLIDIEALKLQAVAGLTGTSRLITWNHAVDLPDPGDGFLLAIWS